VASEMAQSSRISPGSPTPTSPRVTRTPRSTHRGALHRALPWRSASFRVAPACAASLPPCRPIPPPPVRIGSGSCDWGWRSGSSVSRWRWIERSPIYPLELVLKFSLQPLSLTWFRFHPYTPKTDQNTSFSRFYRFDRFII
jgi:hypothetical protein